MKRFKHVAAGCAAIALLAALALWGWRRASAPPVWLAMIDEQSSPLGPVDPRIRSSVWLQEGLINLRNDLLRRPIWRKAEVDVVLGSLRLARLDYVVTHETVHDDAYERYLLSEASEGTIRLRLGSGAPIEASERTRLIDALLERSRAANSVTRSGVVEALCWTGLIFEDPRVEARVKEMMEDPSQLVAGNARRQYRWHSVNRDKYEAYQRRLGRK